MMSTVKVTDESFEKDVLQSSTPVLVDRPAKNARTNTASA